MPLDESFIGRKGSRSRVVIERSAAANFARAVKDENPVFQDAEAAKAAGHDGIPVPPTFLLVAGHWGAYPELQPEDRGGSPLLDMVEEYARQGGLLLHGEQGIEFERPIRVGDVLDTEVEIVDSYDKGSLTFTVAVTRYTDAATGELVATGRGNYINRR